MHVDRHQITPAPVNAPARNGRNVEPLRGELVQRAGAREPVARGRIVDVGGARGGPARALDEYRLIEGLGQPGRLWGGVDVYV